LHETENIEVKRHLIYEGVAVGGELVWNQHDPVEVTGLKAYNTAFLDLVPARWPMLLA
jgi:hypothetical protein